MTVVPFRPEGRESQSVTRLFVNVDHATARKAEKIGPDFGITVRKAKVAPSMTYLELEFRVGTDLDPFWRAVGMQSMLQKRAA